ncbi:hypothetical protein D9M69_679540 [compost metagenome]
MLQLLVTGPTGAIDTLLQGAVDVIEGKGLQDPGGRDMRPAGQIVGVAEAVQRQIGGRRGVALTAADRMVGRCQ